MANYYE
jgi:hypothetical protein